MSASLETQWTLEEDSIIRRCLAEGMQIKQALPLLPKRRIRGLYSRVYTLGLQSGQPRTKHSKDETFWETPNSLNSYYAGLIAADGSVGGYREVLQWTCESADRSSMQGLIVASKFTGQITESVKHHATGNSSIHCRMLVSACQKWNADLARNFNIVPQKSHRLAPPIFTNDLLACCYLIGYTDGDGCISIGKPKGAPEMPVFCYTSASRAILEWLQSFVESRFPFSRAGRPNSIATSHNGNYHHYRVAGMVAIKLFDFLRRIDVPHFARKWDNPAFLALVETYRQKWPEFFAPDKELAFDPAGNIVFASTFTAQSTPTPPISP